jgi:hypothetical protein
LRESCPLRAGRPAEKDDPRKREVAVAADKPGGVRLLRVQAEDLGFKGRIELAGEQGREESRNRRAVATW